MEHKPENYTVVHSYAQAILPPRDQKISGILDENIKMFKLVLRLSPDFNIREFNISRRKEFRAAVMYLDEMVDTASVQNFIMRALMMKAVIPEPEQKQGTNSQQKNRLTAESRLLLKGNQAYKKLGPLTTSTGQSPRLRRHISAQDKITRINVGDFIEQNILPAGQAKKIQGLWDAVDTVLSGGSILVIDGCPHVYATAMQGWEKRGVPTAEREKSIMGPQDAFNETLVTNMALVRRRIRDHRLAIKMQKIGTRSKTDIALMYIDGLANPETIAKVEHKLANVSLDGFISPRQLGELFAERRFNIFPLYQYTERPDKTAGAILQGQIVILMDNANVAMVIPTVIIGLLQSSDDYLFNPIAGTFLRNIRNVGWILTLFMPAMYVALTTINTDALPTELLLSVSKSREGVPYPPWVETVFMGIMIELLLEASARLPGTIGPTATTVGGLIIGQAAAQAQLISNLMIIVAAATVIGSMSIPNYELALAWRVSQAGMIPFAALFGLYGILIAICIYMIYITSLETFGVPYLSPFAPLRFKDLLRDTFFRTSWQSMTDRPDFTNSLDEKRKK